MYDYLLSPLSLLEEKITLVQGFSNYTQEHIRGPSQKKMSDGGYQIECTPAHHHFFHNFLF